MHFVCRCGTLAAITATETTTDRRTSSGLVALLSPAPLTSCLIHRRCFRVAGIRSCRTSTYLLFSPARPVRPIHTNFVGVCDGAMPRPDLNASRSLEKSNRFSPSWLASSGSRSSRGVPQTSSTTPAHSASVHESIISSMS